MKTVLALMLSFAGLAAAQQAASPVGIAPENEPVNTKRVRSVTWDLQNQKLDWVVESGITKDGQFTPSSQEHYQVSPGEQTMTSNGQRRAFTEEEAVWLNHLLSVLTMYCAESVVWWLQGESGTPGQQGPAAEPSRPPDHPDSGPGKIKISYPQFPSAPGAVQLIARNLVY